MGTGNEYISFYTYVLQFWIIIRPANLDFLQIFIYNLSYANDKLFSIEEHGETMISCSRI